MKTFKELNEEIKEQYDHIALVEHVSSINDTQFLTEDLVSIIETHNKNNWSEALDANAFDDHLEKLREEARRGI